MNSQRQIAVIAPEKMGIAFSVLINSVPNQSLLASATSLDELQTILDDKKPDVVLVYLVHENDEGNTREQYGIISRIKSNWPDALCVTIVGYASHVDKAVEFGCDLALVDGVNAQRLLASIEGKSM